MYLRTYMHGMKPQPSPPPSQRMTNAYICHIRHDQAPPCATFAQAPRPSALTRLLASSSSSSPSSSSSGPWSYRPLYHPCQLVSFHTHQPLPSLFTRRPMPSVPSFPTRARIPPAHGDQPVPQRGPPPNPPSDVQRRAVKYDLKLCRGLAPGAVTGSGAVTC
jgi:hypothetical protein